MNFFATNSNNDNNMSSIDCITLDGLDAARYTNVEEEVILDDFLSQQIPLLPRNNLKRDYRGAFGLIPSISLPYTAEICWDNDELGSCLRRQIEKDAAAPRFETKSPIVTVEPTTTTMSTTQHNDIADLYDEPTLVTPTKSTIKKISEVQILIDNDADGSTTGVFDDIMMEAIEVFLHDNVGTDDTTAVTEPIDIANSKAMVDSENQLDLVAKDNLYVHSSTFNLHSDRRMKIRQIERLNKRGMIADTPRNKRTLECMRLGQPIQKPVVRKQNIPSADMLDIIVKKGYTTLNLFTLHNDNKLKLCQIERLQKHGLVANTRRNQQILRCIGRGTTTITLTPQITPPRRRRRRRTSSSAIRKKNLKLIVPSIHLDDDVSTAEITIHTTVTSDNSQDLLMASVEAKGKKHILNRSPIVSSGYFFGENSTETNDPGRVRVNDDLEPADVDDCCCSKLALLEEAV